MPWHICRFQSTLPVGGGTYKGKAYQTGKKNFNPPSPWGEGPGAYFAALMLMMYFNPPSPWGEGRIWFSSDACLR